ncbi:MAG: tetratricopeptide repeat protein [Peristeroidobacter soli]
MKLRSALVLVTAVFLGIAGCGGAQSRYASHMSKGDDFFAAANYEKARIEFRNALQILPNDAQARYRYGRSMEALGKVREAAGMYQGAIDSDANHAGARAALGRVYVFAGAPEKALELVEPALAKNPNDAELLTVRAAARSQLKQPDAALADAELAVKLAPTNENAVALLASIYRQRDESPRAVALLKHTLEKVPTATELRQVLSLLYLSLGEKTGAETEMRKIIEQKPEDMRARYSLAIFLTGEKRLDDAEGVLKAAIAKAPDSDDAKLVYADFLTVQREPARGMKAIEDFLADAPDNHDLRLGLGALHQRTGDKTGAITVYEQVIERAGKKPQGLTARNRIAAMYAAEHKNDAALKLVQEVLAENPRDNDALLLRGNLAMQGNDPASAIGDLRAVLRDQPDAVPVLRALARAHLANREPALAEETLQRAVALNPDDPDVRIELAQLLVQSGKSEQAVPLVEQTVRDKPTHVAARELLVRLYLARADYPAARVAADDLKTLAPTKAVGFYLAGIAAQSENRTADAQVDFEKALALQPEAADALAGLARLHVTSGHMDRAKQVVEAAVARDPRNFAARNLLGELHLASKQYPQAQAEFAKVVATAPQWPLGWRNLALAQAAANDRVASIATLEKGVQNTQSDFSLVADLAALYERNQEFDKAIASYESLVAKHRGIDAAENNLAMLLVTYRKDQKSLDRARELSEPFASSPNPSLLDTHGWVLYCRGQYAEALSVLERAHKIAPQAPVVQFHLGMAQYKSGQSAQARENLQAALQSKSAFAGADEARAALASLPGKG